MSPIAKLLVANRGEIAARVLRTARDMGIDTVAVFADPDADAPHVALADEAVRLPGSAPAETYLRGDLIVERALAVGADAVHPGYGFLSESAPFARACLDAGLVFVGPAPDVIAAMGSKVEAKARMAAAGVPVLPGVTLDDATDLAAAAAAVGFPLLVKAAHGGGGRGMRVVDRPAELADAVAGARREAREAFGDGEVFLERYVVDPRHVEVQVFGDTTGAVVHLFERECSIQRRHQKILEECPSPAVGDALRAELGAAAVAAAEAVGYVGAGTVEFVLDGRGDFFFLEMNTRLQVEHPVTEMVTGLDLVELQIRVAEGEALPTEVRNARITGHAIEARLYAEDVAAGFLPVVGTLRRFDLDPGPGVRVDAGVAEGSTVSPYYDPMLAKVVAHGSTRRDAARRLARTLSHARLRGVTTNRDLLVGVLREPEFLAGRTDTGYLTRHDPAVLAHRATADPRPAVVAAAMAQQAAGHAPGASPARRHTSTAPGHSRFALGDHEIDVGYRLGPGEPSVSVDGETVDDLRLLGTRADAVALEIGGVRRRYRVERDGDAVEVDGPGGRIELTRLPRLTDPTAAAHEGSLQAPMPGAVLRVLAEAGAAVAAGQPLVVLEAMKMEHTLSTPTAGVLAAVSVAVGDQVDTGQVLALVEPQEGEGTVR